jgi:hypothetical protein
MTVMIRVVAVSAAALVVAAAAAGATLFSPTLFLLLKSCLFYILTYLVEICDPFLFYRN